MSDLTVLENKATEHLEVWKRAYWQFWTILLEIRDTGIWEQSGQGTWEGYLESRWLPQLKVSYERIRQIQAAYPIMRLIESVTGVTPNENQIRNLKASVPTEDHYLLPEVYSRTLQYTSSPAPRHYVAAYEVLKNRDITNTVSVAGESRVIDVVDAATKEAIEESDKRRNQHITDNAQTALVLLQPTDFRKLADGKLIVVFENAPDNVMEWLAKIPKPLTAAVPSSANDSAGRRAS